MQILRLTAVAPLVLLLALGLAGAQRPAPSSEGEAPIREVLDRFEEAFERRDAKLYASSFTLDADWESSFGSREQGRADIEKRLAGVYTMFQQADQTIEDVRIRFITPDVAVAETVRTIAGQTGSWDQPLPARRVRTTAVLRKDDGTWLVDFFRAADLRVWEE